MPDLRNRSSVVLVALVSAMSAPVSANSIGTDLNLTGHPITGGMGGAGYTIALEPSAALFGNPATLTQLPGTHFNLGVNYIHFFGNVNQQSFRGLSNDSTSTASDYFMPLASATFELVQDLVLGIGVEADAGVGVDFRTDPVTLFGTATDTMAEGIPVAGTALPVLAQIISFNTNIGLAYEFLDRLSIGAAFTLGFGLFQAGTAGNTAGLSAATFGLVADFGGTTSDVLDFGVGGSVGATWNPWGGLYLSVGYKSPVKYGFDAVVSTTVTPTGAQVYQELTVTQPQEVTFGIAARDLVPDLVLAVDAVWKNWERADTYKDLYQNQWLVMLGGQYTIAKLVSVRLGYHYSSSILRDTPKNQLGDLSGVGTIPLGDAGEPFSSALTTIVQTALLPVIWQHTITAGVGVQITDAVRADAFGAIALPNEASRSPAALSELVGAPVVYTADVDPQLSVGAGLQVAFGDEPAN